MPSKSLVSSWTISFVPSGTRFPHSPHTACPGNLPSPPRLRVIRKHLHGLWKGTLSPRKVQLARGPMLRRVSSTINLPGVTLASRPPPTASPSLLFFSPTSPTSPTLGASLPSCVDTDSNGIKFSEVVTPGNILFRPFRKSLSPGLPLFSSAGLPVPPLELSLSPPSSCRRRQQQPVSLYDHPSSLRVPRVVSACGSGSTLDAAGRLRDFRALIDEMRATLLHHDSKEEFDVGNQCDDEDDEERERLLRLLEDVMRKVKQLDQEGHGCSVTMTSDAAP